MFLNFIKLLMILAVFSVQVNLILVFLLFIQNKFTKANILNIYSSGIFLNFNEIKLIIEKLTKVLIFYFILNSLEISY